MRANTEKYLGNRKLRKMCFAATLNFAWPQSSPIRSTLRSSDVRFHTSLLPSSSLIKGQSSRLLKVHLQRPDSGTKWSYVQSLGLVQTTWLQRWHQTQPWTSGLTNSLVTCQSTNSIMTPMTSADPGNGHDANRMTAGCVNKCSEVGEQTGGSLINNIPLSWCFSQGHDIRLIPEVLERHRRYPTTR